MSLLRGRGPNGPRDEDTLRQILNNLVAGIRTNSSNSGLFRVILSLLIVNGKELYGPNPTSAVIRQANLTATACTLANIINAVLAVPLFCAIAGFLGGIAIGGSLYMFSGVLQKASVNRPNMKNPWAMAAFAANIWINVFLTSLSPHGSILLLFQDDLNQKYAVELVQGYVTKNLSVQLENAKEEEESAKEAQRLCDEKVAEYERKRAEGSGAHHTAYIEAHGPYIFQAPPDRWNDVPDSQLPRCPYAQRLEVRVKGAQEAAQKALDKGNADIARKWGNNFVGFLQDEHSKLFEANFAQSLNGLQIRSGTTRLGKAHEMIFSGNAASFIVITILTLVSAITSGASLVLTNQYANHELVRQSWRPVPPHFRK